MYLIISTSVLQHSFSEPHRTSSSQSHVLFCFESHCSISSLPVAHVWRKNWLPSLGAVASCSSSVWHRVPHLCHRPGWLAWSCSGLSGIRSCSGFTGAASLSCPGDPLSNSPPVVHTYYVIMKVLTLGVFIHFPSKEEVWGRKPQSQTSHPSWAESTFLPSLSWLCCLSFLLPIKRAEV